MSYWVYVHTCKANGKRYVGVTTKTKPEYRWREGKGYWYNKYFYSAILKHGWDSFEHEVFEVDSEEEMYRKEVELISFYHSNDPKFGYNNSSGGEKSSSGCTRSEEYVKHLSEACKERWADPGFREKVVEAMKSRSRKPFSVEARKRMSEAAKKRGLDPEYRRKISEISKNWPRIKIKLPDGTIVETTKQVLTRWYINKGKKFEYVD